MTENLKTGRWNPSRVMTAIGRIGYSPAAAILDIVDNAVSAGATVVTIDLDLEQEQREGRGRRRSFVSAIRIADNGSGMDEARLEEAIALGSSDDHYDAGTLSRFGLGLKSASASLGRRLTIVTRDSAMKAMTLIQDQDVIDEHQAYVYELADSSSEATAALDEVAPGGSGTLITIAKIHQNNMTSPGEILTSLQKRAGVVYYFSIRDQGLRVVVQGDAVAPMDPLFIDDAVGDLNSRDWDGLSVQYITRPQTIQLTADGAVTAQLTVTQLPHPPSMQKAEILTRAQTRERYNIGAGQYGVYVYRNGRLIEWAASLDMVSQDQDLYSFRARLEIGSDADDVLNIDVTKSRILLSDTARIQLTPLISEATKQSKQAWLAAGRAVDSIIADSAHDDINEHLDRISTIEEENDRLDEEASPEAEREKLKQRRERATAERPANADEQEAVREKNQRVQYVAMLDNNMLWERAHDASQGIIVRVNMSHRLYRDVIQPLRQNAPLIKLLDVLFYTLARAEFDLVYKTDQLEEAVAEAVMDEYRERVGGILSETIRLAGADSITAN